MAKIKCPGCGAEVDTESGQAEFTPPAQPVEAPEPSGDGVTDDIAQVKEPARKPRRFGWRQ